LKEQINKNKDNASNALKRKDAHIEMLKANIEKLKTQYDEIKELCDKQAKELEEKLKENESLKSKCHEEQLQTQVKSVALTNNPNTKHIPHSTETIDEYSRDLKHEVRRVISNSHSEPICSESSIFIDRDDKLNSSFM
jgi:SMC interacting uncharacterized protein involved in chromosome segregation